MESSKCYFPRTTVYLEIRNTLKPQVREIADQRPIAVSIRRHARRLEWSGVNKYVLIWRGFDDLDIIKFHSRLQKT